MAQDRPTFEAPPVVETVLSVQFEKLPGYSAAHAGWFWKEYLEKFGAPSKEWTQATDAPRAEDQFERFGAEDIWAVPPVKLIQGIQSPRVQFIRSDGERMIQLQDTRFILNWRKQSSEYPSYDSLLPEFRLMVSAFESFAAEAKFGTPKYNQWEIAYVDQVKKGDLWESVGDWVKIFPGFSMPPVDHKKVPNTGDERMSADWRFSLAEKRGRMYISLRQARLQPSNEEALQLMMTARGPVSDSDTWESGFTIGHGALNQTFISISSPEALQHWKRRK